MQPLVVLFAKVPVPGRVKTRLAKAIGDDAAALLHAAFLEDAIASARRLRGITVELHTDIPWPDAPLPNHVQHSGDLGERMYAALEHGLRSGYSPVLILGTDIPTLPFPYVQSLISMSGDVLLGPTHDGGFYGIGARRIHPEMFANVDWGRASTLAATVSAVERSGLSVSLGPAWFDIDEPVDLERLRASPAVPEHTRAALARITLGSGTC
jgi:rSAM/selenodomain-associated transferase 1